LAKEQIVTQGKQIFETVHSLQSLMDALRRPAQGGSPADARIADRIQSFLTAKACAT
jgi:hypothetical protein